MGKTSISMITAVSSEVCTGALHNSNHIHQMLKNEKLTSLRNKRGGRDGEGIPDRSAHAVRDINIETCLSMFLYARLTERQCHNHL